MALTAAMAAPSTKARPLLYGSDSIGSASSRSAGCLSLHKDHHAHVDVYLRGRQVLSFNRVCLIPVIDNNDIYDADNSSATAEAFIHSSSSHSSSLQNKDNSCSPEQNSR